MVPEKPIGRTPTGKQSPHDPDWWLTTARWIRWIESCVKSKSQTIKPAVWVKHNFLKHQLWDNRQIANKLREKVVLMPRLGGSIFTSIVTNDISVTWTKEIEGEQFFFSSILYCKKQLEVGESQYPKLFSPCDSDWSASELRIFVACDGCRKRQSIRQATDCWKCTPLKRPCFFKANYYDAIMMDGNVHWIYYIVLYVCIILHLYIISVLSTKRTISFLALQDLQSRDVVYLDQQWSQLSLGDKVRWYDQLTWNIIKKILGELGLYI